jgi:putative transposase
MDARRRAGLVLALANWPTDPPRGAVTRFARANAVSREWVHQVLRRLAAEGLEATLQPASRAPRNSPQAVSRVIADLACRVRAELEAEGWDVGPISVQARLQAMGVQPPSRATLARIFTRAGLIAPQPRKRPRSSYHRFVYPLPNDCWQLDAFETRLADGSKATVFQVTDDHSRYAISSRAAAAETGVDAVAVVTAGIEAHGVPTRLLTDNGSAFNMSRRGQSTALTTYLISLGVSPITGRPSHPTTQGKNERHHQTTQKWLEKQPAPRDLEELQALLDRFDDAYNTSRPHQALHGRTPAQAYAALPKAIPPVPPETVLERDRQQLHRRVVDSRGVIYACRRQFKIGRAYTGRTITVLTDGHLFHLIDDRGTVIDTHTDPQQDSYIPRNPEPSEKS